MKKLILLPLILISCSSSSLIEGIQSIDIDKGELGDTIFENQGSELELISKLEAKLEQITNPDEKLKMETKLAELKLDNLDQIIDQQLYDALKNLFNEDGEDEAFVNELEKGVGNSISKDALTKLANGTLVPPSAKPYKIWDEATKTLKNPNPLREFNNQTEYERVDSKIADLKYNLTKVTSQKAKDNLNKRISELEKTKSRMSPTTLNASQKDDVLIGDPLIRILSQEILDEVEKLKNEYGDDELLNLGDLFNERSSNRRALVSYVGKFRGIKNKIIAYSVFKYNNALKRIRSKRGK